MNHKSNNSIRAPTTKAIAGTKMVILLLAASASFAIGFVIGVVRVTLGLYQEHRSFAELLGLAKVALSDIRIASGMTSSATPAQENIA